VATSGATDGQYWRDRSVATAANIGAPGTRSSVSEDQNAKCALFSVCRSPKAAVFTCRQ
jgi:hypothetical protein